MAKDRGRYGSVYCAMQDSPEWQRLSLDASAVWNALKLGRDNNTAGVFPFYREALSQRSRVPLERVQDALRELEREDWIRMEGAWVWLRNSLLYDPHFSPESEKHVKGLIAVIGGLPHIQLVRDFVSYYVDLGYLPADFQHVEKTAARSRKGYRRGIPRNHSTLDTLPNPEAVAVAESEAKTETEVGRESGARDDAGPPTPATPAEARDVALAVLGPPPEREAPTCTERLPETPAARSSAPVAAEPTCTPTGPEAWRHEGVAYRAGDTLPDGRTVVEVVDGVPVLRRPGPRTGPPGELEAAQRELMAELPLAAAAVGLPADMALAKFSRTPSGQVITNPWNVTSLPWLRTTLERLRGARLVAQAERYEPQETTAAADPDADLAAFHAIRRRADEYAAWCRERDLPWPHRDTVARWESEVGVQFGERERLWFVGEYPRLQRESAEARA